MTPDTDPLFPLTDEFVARLRRGERPAIEDYASAHPALADRIRQLFPTLLLLEGLAAAPPDRTTDHVPLEPGFEVSGRTFGPYRMIREIGRGGMGVVFEAEHATLHRRVALKLLTVTGPNAGSRLERFFREAQIAAGLHHTNIVPVFDVGQIGGRAYYAMQFIAGESLDHTPRTTPADYRRVADFGRQAAVGLAYAHQRGVIHRDIKPANLLVDDQGTLWITDFGLARRLDDATLTADGQMLGTPRYMSPEQAAAATSPIDHRTDIYSLGVSLYELLVGRPAHDGQTPPEVVNQILTRDPAPLRAVDPNLPRDLETVVLKAMARRPADRYQTAQELADDLGRFASGEPVKARRIGVLGRTWRWAKREPKVASLIAAVLLTLTAGVVGTGIYADSAHRAEVKSKQLSDEMYAQLVRSKAEGVLYGNMNRRDFKCLLWLSEHIKLASSEDEKRVCRQAIANILRHDSIFYGIPEQSHVYSGESLHSTEPHQITYPANENHRTWQYRHFGDKTDRVVRSSDGRYGYTWLLPSRESRFLKVG